MSVPGYVVERRLGRGSMGVVDLAVGPDGARVALKRIVLHGSDDALAEARARIRREAEVLGRLDHPRIVGLLDVLDGTGDDADDRADDPDDDVVLVMPWMRGGSLADRVARLGPLPADEVANIADHLLGALAAAHRAGVVHRDIKPANVLFDERSRPHLADFGVATARDLTAGLTAAGRALGTPGFLAPEQARGESAGPASDVFSLGATLRWALTTTGPYGEGPRDALLWRAAQGKVEPTPRSVPQALRRRIDAMLDPRADRRPSAASLAGGPEGTDERPVASIRRPGARRRRWTAVAAVVAAGVAITGAVVALADDGSTDGNDTAGPTEPARTSTTCVGLPYQPCGALPAPGTDGQACIEDRADYDGDTTNGCEALPDDRDGAALGTVEATIVPADDVDQFTVDVDDNFQLGCDGRITFELTAPPGMALRLVVLDEDHEVIGEVTSADGVAGELRIREPDCGGDDGGTLAAVVTPVGSDRSGEPYALERSGNW